MSPILSKSFVPGSVLVLMLAAALSLSAQSQPKPGAPPTPAKPGGIDVPVEYLIGEEDVIGVLFWRDQEMSGDLVVRPDGRITLPLIGEMQAAGVTPKELGERIQAAAAKYLSDANVAVVVRQINSRKVFITGQVLNPGAYPLPGPRNVMQIIALAGGLTEYADAKSITIMRRENGRSRSFAFNYKDVARGKKLEQNIDLKPGDTVVVP